jgi:hypothetical protein
MLRPVAILVCLMAAFAAGCSTGAAPTLTSGLPEKEAVPAPEALPALPGMSAIANLTKGAALPVGTPTDVYTRVARGALTCWFGASGPLKGPYIYHADADPPSKGGKAEIDIRTRDRDAADPRSLKAFHIGIEAGGEGTRVDVQNVKIPEPLAARLTADVSRWAADQEGCGETPITSGWSAAPAAAASPKAAATKTTSVKTTPKVKP